jgi:hypothetical protein
MEDFSLLKYPSEWEEYCWQSACGLTNFIFRKDLIKVIDSANAELHEGNVPVLTTLDYDPKKIAFDLVCQFLLPESDRYVLRITFRAFKGRRSWRKGWRKESKKIKGWHILHVLSREIKWVEHGKPRPVQLGPDEKIPTAILSAERTVPHPEPLPPHMEAA